jgi:hypothetical protein
MRQNLSGKAIDLGFPEEVAEASVYIKCGLYVTTIQRSSRNNTPTGVPSYSP